MTLSRLAVLAAGCALSAACAIGPRHQRPAVAVPETFRGQAAAGPASFADSSWRDVFKDDKLQRLITAALAGNYDLREAVARLEAAQAGAMQARGALIPQLGYQGIAARGKNSFLASPFLAGGATGDSFLGAFTASWELDFWGRLRRLDEAARARYLASDGARKAVSLSLVASVAQGYFELLELDRQLEIAQRTQQSFAQSLELFNRRFVGGVASKLEVARAEAARASVAAAVPELERRIQIHENALCALLGREPGPIARSANLLDQTVAADIPTGLPSALLERRPDLRAAEALVRAANAQMGAAMSDFLPSISLAGLLGGTSLKLSQLTSSNSQTWAAQGRVTGPIFTGGRVLGAYRENKAAWEEARLRYQQLAVTAFQDVANALVSRQKYDQELVEQEKSVKAYTEAVKTALERYGAGKAEYFEVLEAQQQLFPEENTLAQMRLGRTLSLVSLYKALGGGWK